MLIDFSVTNFRSFRERQTLSMVAAPRLSKRENLLSPIVDGENLPDLLRVAAIYGPNASGKSNLLRALDVVNHLANTVPSTAKSLQVSPFRFDRTLDKEPSHFEVNFITKSQRYLFELSLTAERVVKEVLVAFPKGKPTLLYSRQYEETEGESYDFGSLEGGAELHLAWRRLTSPTTLFIAQAVINSSEELNQLRAPFTWLQEGLFVIDDGLARYAKTSQNLIRKNDRYGSNLATFLDDVDVPIKSVRVESIPRKSTKQFLSETFGAGKPSTGEDVEKTSRTIFSHTSRLGEAEFDFDDESEGTKGLVGFWVPWNMIIQEDVEQVMAIDEMDSSLHPEIVASLVRKYIKTKGTSQLIFTTHDTHLMDSKILRRDQLWITERDVNGATQLRSIHDFKGRESEDVEKRYFEGRYRGLPILRRS